MQFLKILFWCLLAFVAALFTYGNWNTVPVRLWSGLIADINLPLLLLITFLAGLLPALVGSSWRRWRLRQRLAATEALAQAQAALSPPAPVIVAHEPAPAPVHVTPSAPDVTPDPA
jgi:putative membrane protein